MIKFFSPLNLILLVALAATVVAGFIVIPAGTLLPVHWNLVGEPDVFMPHEVALLVPPGIVVLAWSIFFVVDRFLARPADRDAGAYVTNVAITALTAIFLAIAAATVAIGTGSPISMVHVVAIAIGVLFLVLGNAMPKSRPNSYAGIRMPTTLRSESNWQATHRLGGWLTMAGGAILIAAAFLVPPSVLIWWTLGCILVPMLIAAAYSLVLARRGV